MLKRPLVSYLTKSHTRPFRVPSRPYTSAIPPGRYSESLQLCANSVKKLDYPHYFSSLFQDKEVQIANLAIRSFNIEVASIKSNPSRELSEMKMDWWKQSIKRMFEGEIINHPTLLVLREVTLRKKLSKTWFTKYLDAREKDLRVVQPSHLGDVEAYAEATQSSLLYMLLEAQGIRNIDADHVASHLGKAYGLVTILRAIPYQAKVQQTYIPKDLLIQQNVSTEQLLRGDMTSESRNVIYEVANLANQHIEFARELQPKVPKGTNRIFLPTEFYASYLKQLGKVDFDPFHTSLKSMGTFGTRPKIVKHYLTNTF